MFKKSVVMLSMAALSLYGCGGGGGSSTPTVTVKTGVFIDSAVANVSYKTATRSGTTNAKGEFTYVDGETVTFSIGSLEFPPTTAQDIITPMTMAGATSVTDQTATNIARLLQSLDSDGIPTNGITIAAQAVTLATSNDYSSIDFTVATADFETSGIATLVADSGSTTKTLISEVDAQAHVEASLSKLIVGAWGGNSSTGGFNYLVLLPNNTFLYTENDTNATGPNENGLEIGTYTYNSNTGEITFDITYDDNAPGNNSGLGDIGTPSVLPVTLSNNSSTLTVVGTPLVLPKVGLASAQPEVGMWYYPQIGAGFNYLLLLANNTFIYAENDLGYSEPDNGVEVGTYSYNSSTGEATFNITYDDNAPGNDSGIGNIGTPAVQTLALSNQNATLTFAGFIPLSKILASGNNTVLGNWSSDGGSTDMFYFDPLGEYSHIPSGEIGTYITAKNSFADNTLKIINHTDEGAGPPGGFDDGAIGIDMPLQFTCDSTANTTTMSLTLDSIVYSFNRMDLNHPIVGKWNVTGGGTDTFIFDRNYYYYHNSGEIGKYTYDTALNNLQIVSHFTDGDGTGGIDGAAMNVDITSALSTTTSVDDTLTLTLPGMTPVIFTRDTSYNGNCI